MSPLRANVVARFFFSMLLVLCMPAACRDKAEIQLECGSRSKVFVDITDDRRSVLVAAPGGSYMKFDVVDVCVREGESPRVNGFHWGNDSVTVRYANTCVAQLDLDQGKVICVACD